jgi:hypothetical protein
MAQKGYRTNLASEFYVLSLLQRVGFDAHLTLGNKKSVDIVVVHAPGDSVTVDVKAVAGKVDWPMGNISAPPLDRHFVVLLTYDGNFSAPDFIPRTWVIPHADLLGMIESAAAPSKMRFVRRRRTVEWTAYKDAWHLLGPREARNDERQG